MWEVILRPCPTESRPNWNIWPYYHRCEHMNSLTQWKYAQSYLLSLTCLSFEESADPGNVCNHVTASAAVEAWSSQHWTEPRRSQGRDALSRRRCRSFWQTRREDGVQETTTVPLQRRRPTPSGSAYAWYTPPTSTRRNCQVESRRLGRRVLGFSRWFTHRTHWSAVWPHNWNCSVYVVWFKSILWFGDHNDNGCSGAETQGAGGVFSSLFPGGDATPTILLKSATRSQVRRPNHYTTEPPDWLIPFHSIYLFIKTRHAIQCKLIVELDTQSTLVHRQWPTYM